MDDGSVGTTGSIDLTETPKVADLSGGVHLLPCTIKYDGPCSVSHYFKPKSSGIEADGLSVQEAYFRGRKLRGATISFPNGYSGYVIGKKSSGRTSSSGDSESNNNSWEAKAKFGCITYWNHDVLPSQEDAVLRSFHWLPIVEADEPLMIIYDKDSTSYEVPAKDLSIIWGKDKRYWQWIQLQDEDMRKTGFKEGVVLQQVNWIEVTGKAHFDLLKAGKYEVFYVVKFRPDAFGWHSAPIRYRIKSNGMLNEDKVVKLEGYRKKEEAWHEISGGEFFIQEPEGPVTMVFGMFETETSWWKGGMVLAGVKIKPPATEDSSHEIKAQKM